MTSRCKCSDNIYYVKYGNLHYGRQPLTRNPRPLTPRMMRRVQCPEPLFGNMGINFGCRDVGVTEHRLHSAQVCAVHQQVGCECVSKRMR